MVPPSLLGITIYLPDGQVKKFTPKEIIAYGAAPTVVVGVREGNKLTKYAGFPTVIHEEEATIELLPGRPGLVGVG